MPCRPLPEAWPRARRNVVIAGLEVRCRHHPRASESSTLPARARPLSSLRRSRSQAGSPARPSRTSPRRPPSGRTRQPVPGPGPAFALDALAQRRVVPPEVLVAEMGRHVGDVVRGQGGERAERDHPRSFLVQGCACGKGKEEGGSRQQTAVRLLYRSLRELRIAPAPGLQHFAQARHGFPDVFVAEMKCARTRTGSSRACGTRRRLRLRTTPPPPDPPRDCVKLTWPPRRSWSRGD